MWKGGSPAFPGLEILCTCKGGPSPPLLASSPGQAHLSHLHIKELRSGGLGFLWILRGLEGCPGECVGAGSGKIHQGVNPISGRKTHESPRGSKQAGSTHSSSLVGLLCFEARSPWNPGLVPAAAGLPAPPATAAQWQQGPDSSRALRPGRGPRP